MNESGDNRGDAPSAELLHELLESSDPRPIVMVNLMKVRDEAELNRYVQIVGPLIIGLGGSFEFAGPVAESVVGDADWDRVGLVRYPNRRVFAEMQLSEAYLAAVPHRTAGLARSDVFIVDG
jgi:uncharacterized protein (DUF1330 family)